MSSRPPVEPLESRRLLAAIVLQNRVLHVTAPGASASTITVGISADLSAVVASVAWDTGRGAQLKPHLLSESFPVTDDITRVIIVGSDQADTITIDQTESGAVVNAYIIEFSGLADGAPSRTWIAENVSLITDITVTERVQTAGGSGPLGRGVSTGGGM